MYDIIIIGFRKKEIMIIDFSFLLNKEWLVRSDFITALNLQLQASIWHRFPNTYFSVYRKVYNRNKFPVSPLALWTLCINIWLTRFLTFFLPARWRFTIEILSLKSNAVWNIGLIYYKTRLYKSSISSFPRKETEPLVVYHWESVFPFLSHFGPKLFLLPLAIMIQMKIAWHQEPL